LIVHRSLFDGEKVSNDHLKTTADHISATERNSSDAERDSKNVKLQAYLESQLKSGKLHPYTALVTDLRNFGFFVDVPDLGMSGLVPLSLLDDDFYEFDPAANRIFGRRTRRVIQLGDQVEVQIAKVDTAKRQTDFRLVPTPGRPGRTSKRGRQGSRQRGSDKEHKETGARSSTTKRTQRKTTTAHLPPPQALNPSQPPSGCGVPPQSVAGASRSSLSPPPFNVGRER